MIFSKVVRTEVRINRVVHGRRKYQHMIWPRPNIVEGGEHPGLGIWSRRAGSNR